MEKLTEKQVYLLSSKNDVIKRKIEETNVFRVKNNLTLYCYWCGKIVKEWNPRSRNITCDLCYNKIEK